MVASIAQLISVINPDKYAKFSEDKQENKKELAKFKKLIKEKGHLAAAEKAIPNSDGSHEMVYETYAEGLESVYFFIVDLMEEFGLEPEKLIDNFTASPGSTQFAELGGRATAMQQHATRVMGEVNTIVRGILNLVYDLKEMKMRLRQYDDYNNPKLKEQALLALKQIWMDKVDMQKGNSSIKALATSQIGFVTLIDAFLAAQTVEDVKKIDLNERVKRILIQRLADFNHWVQESERELRKRFNIEKTYLKSQVNALKITSRWARPYFMAAQKLEQKERSRDTSLVTSFNRTVLELTILGKRKIDPIALAVEEKFPKHLAKKKNVDKLRPYSEVVLIDFIFKAVPVQGKLIGKVQIAFRGYALNNQEIAKLDELLDDSDVNEMLKLVEGITDDTLLQIKEDIDEYLEDISPTKPKGDETPSGDVNPFLAMFGFYNKKSEKKAASPDSSTKKAKIVIKKDSYDEKTYLRPHAASEAATTVYTLFDIYKKAHGMPSFL